MRPQILFPLFADVTRLPGIGPRLGGILRRLTGPSIIDLLWHLPSGIIDRRYSPTVAEAPSGVICTIEVTVLKHQPGRTRQQPYRVSCGDDTGELELVFFHARADYLLKILPEGEKRVVSGRMEVFQGRKQISHPDHVVPPNEADAVRRVEPTYPLTAGLTAKPLSKAIEAAIGKVPALAEWQEPHWLIRQGWSSWHDSLKKAHKPENIGDIDPASAARARLAYDEFLADQLALALVRRSQRSRPGRAFTGDGALIERGKGVLPFVLTGSQNEALKEIFDDMAAPHRMMRILQGDVGSGKTVVAFLAMLKALESGAQAALMAPTEVLARQHFKTIEPLATKIGIKAALLTGRDKGKARKAVLEDLESGALKIAIGTHALFQDDVSFHDLGLAVIDEQHRFGVHQRLMLGAKGKTPVDILVMTATPIPRTLMMSCYSDLDSSRLTEKPAGRKPVETRVLPVERMDDVIGRLKPAIDKGSRVFWVCPLVEESEVVDLAAATDRHAMLNQRFPDRVALLHGQMKAADKDRSMARFAGGDADILVATTVIEVGVDVPEATIMVIEHAERFGLAQLHQLRGRVGRGDAASSCLLLYAPPLTETARARLEILRETEDGFKIAEEDLRLRGAGEILGTRQSGLPEYKVADLAEHRELLEAARDDTKLILERDPELKSERGKALRVLLYLFERDAMAQTLQSG